MVVGWLGAMRRSSDLKNRNSARWKLENYSFEEPNWVLADSEEKAEWRAFEEWLVVVRGSTEHRPLAFDFWCRSFEAVAVKAEAAAEELRRKATAESWHSWGEEGPAKGLRRQHQMTRTQVGWIPTPKTTQVKSEIEEHDEADGLSNEELDKILHDPGKVIEPIGAQHQANAEAKKWGGEWRDGDVYIEPEWPEDMPPPSKKLQLEAFKVALSTFPTDTGLGWDRLHPQALLRLSDST